jgi:hypothetical protein
MAERGAGATPFFMLTRADRTARDAEMNLTIGRTRELFFLIAAICVVVLILIGVFTWEDIAATVVR